MIGGHSLAQLHSFSVPSFQSQAVAVSVWTSAPGSQTLISRTTEDSKAHCISGAPPSLSDECLVISTVTRKLG